MSQGARRVVIVGAGIVGNSLAYHLSRLGTTEVTLVDTGPMPRPGGSTGHASNFIFPVDHRRQLTALIAESMRQYEELGVMTTSGGIEVARTEARMQELERRIDSGSAFGVSNLEMISPAEIRARVPYIDESELLGGFHSPSACVVDSVQAATIMRERAVEAGVTVLDETEVLGIDSSGDRVRGVRTSRGELVADRVVIASGAWSPRIAAMAGARLALIPMVHQMVDVGPVPRFAAARSLIEWPIVRDMDSGMYEHQKWTGMHIGSYAHRPIVVEPGEIPSLQAATLSPTELPFTDVDFAPQMATARRLMPEILEDPTVHTRYAINGVLSVTLDGMPLLGEMPEVAGLWVAAGVWVREGPAVGRAMAELMVLGDSEIDVHHCEVARAHPHQRTRAHVVARATEGFPKMYGIVHPAEQWESDRPHRLSPFYERERELGASFVETGGWERPHWYESNARLLDEYGDRITRREAEWDARWWSPIIEAEHLAMRDRAAVIDLTAFSIFDVVGPGALDAVQRIAMRQMDVAVGRVVYTPILTPSGGFRADLTIMRLGDGLFRVVTGAAHGMADHMWFADHLPADGSAQIHDRTNAWATLGLWGPRARDILERVTADDVSHEGLGFGRCRELELGALHVLASRISYVGDLGWELHVPFEQGALLWDTLFEAGHSDGLVAAGIGVYNTTGRLEKGYRAYAAELDSGFDVVEAGLAWGPVKEEEFIGRTAHIAHRATRPAASLCTLTVDSHRSSSGVNRYMPANVPILTVDGEPIVDGKGRTSHVTSAGPAPSLGAYILLGYLPGEHAVVGRRLSVRYLGDRYPVTVRSIDATPLLDPDNARIRR